MIKSLSMFNIFFKGIEGHLLLTESGISVGNCHSIIRNDLIMLLKMLSADQKHVEH